VRKKGTRTILKKGEGLFFQGDPHTGVWVVEKGRIRTFYAAPTGREITSADALEECELLFLSGMSLRSLVLGMPDVALAVIDGLVAKGKCYSALIQMLGTRSISERLEQLLLILADTHGRNEGGVVIIDRSITYEQVASIVGATRQWVTQSLDKLQREGVLKISRKEITIYKIDQLAC